MQVLLQIFFFILPLLFWFGLNQVFELPKFVWFLVFGIGVIGIYRAIEIFRNQKISFQLFKSHKIFWITLGIYFFYLIINTIFALSPETSFWGDYSRHTGLLFYFGILIFLLILSSYKWQKEDFVNILKSFIYSGTFVSILSIYQLFDPNRFGDITVMSGRIFGTLGQPNYLGEFLVITTLLTFLFVLKYLFLKKRKIILYTILFIIQIISLYFSSNRASWIAVVIGVLVILLIWTYIFKRIKRTKLLAGSIIFVIVMGLVGSYILFHSNTNNDFLRSFETRKNLYPSVVSYVLESPWIGYGFNSFLFGFTKFLPKEMAETEDFKSLPGKAHNEVLDILAEQGIVGLIFLIILAYYLFNRIKKVFKNHNVDQQNKLLLGSLAVIFVSLEISYLAGFATITTLVYSIFLVFGMLYMSVIEDGEPLESSNNNLILFPAIFLVVYSFIYIYIGATTLVSDYYYKQASDSFYSGKSLDISEGFLKNALKISLFPYEYSQLGIDFAKDTKLRKEMLDYIFEKNKYDYFVFLQKGREAAIVNDEKGVNDSFRAAYSLCPNCPYVYYYWSNAIYKFGDFKSSLELTNKYFDLLPSYVKESNLNNLNSYQKNRLRIFMKPNENKSMQEDMMKLKDLLTEKIGSTYEKVSWEVWKKQFNENVEVVGGSPKGAPSGPVTRNE